MRTRLRPAYTSAELEVLYATPHDHTRWPDHVARVEATVALARQLGVPGSVADLSCGDAAIARALGVDVLILGDLAPGYGITGPVERTVHEIPRVGMFLLCETLEHLDDPDAALATVREKADSLVLSTPLAESHAGNPEHYWGWDNDGIREMLAATGWDPVVQRNISPLDENDIPWHYQLWGCR